MHYASCKEWVFYAYMLYMQSEFLCSGFLIYEFFDANEMKHHLV